MKSVKTLVFAALLVFSLAFNTFAGDVDVPGAKPSPTPQLLAGDDQTPLVTNTDTQYTEATSETSDYLFYEALAALLSVY
ncbi:MAG TPA: hypothetical protein VHS05_13270 [Pyrinomonadaceae bacterium]|jgi:hypothetical protein|nr:hypothetical protein [Pyrinomonadaceae bacterium]